MSRFLGFLVLAVGLPPAGCGDVSDDAPADVATDAADDGATGEGGADADADAEPETGADADADAGADVADVPIPDGGPRTCGPMPGMACLEGEICDLRSCGDGATGLCVTRPGGCADIWEPVCGCDGVTYGNDCDRLTAGVALDHAGACGSGSMCGGIAGFGCPGDEVCDIRGCYPDAAGTCVPRPTGCFTVWDPVCGCDGVTYGNDCERLRAEAALDHPGECSTTALCKPECRAASGGHTGWFNPCTGVMICPAACTGCSAECGAIESRSEGWYADCIDPTFPGGCSSSGSASSLIVWADCG